MTNETLFTELPQEEQKLLIDEVMKLKLTCEPKKMTVGEIYKLIDEAEKSTAGTNNNVLAANSEVENNPPVEQPENVSSENQSCEQPEKKSDSEQKPAAVEKNKKSDGLCITCYSRVYNGVCSGCGRQY